MSETKKTIKGQAWISGDKLVQDQITFELDGTVTSEEKVLIENIWEDSLFKQGSTTVASNPGNVTPETYKYIVYSTTKNKDGEEKPSKCYFFWEYAMTDTENSDSEVVVRLECPKPKQGIFGPCYPYSLDNPESGSEYAEYYINKLNEASENFENAAAIQKKEIIFPGTQRIDFTSGGVDTTKEFRVNNSDIGDITNLLSLF